MTLNWCPNHEVAIVLPHWGYRLPVSVSQEKNVDSCRVLNINDQIAFKKSEHAVIQLGGLTVCFLPLLLQPNIVQLRDRLCRAQGKPAPGQESSKSPYERQPLSKGRPGPSAGHPQMPRVQTQQYYPHVSVRVQMCENLCTSALMEVLNCSLKDIVKPGRASYVTVTLSVRLRRVTSFMQLPYVWFKLVLIQSSFLHVHLLDLKPVGKVVTTWLTLGSLFDSPFFRRPWRLLCALYAHRSEADKRSAQRAEGWVCCARDC